MLPFMRLIWVTLLSVAICSVLSNAKAAETWHDPKVVEIDSAIGDIPPLIITLAPDVRFSRVDKVFSVVYVFKKGADETRRATMLINVGAKCQQAQDVIGNNKIRQDVARFSSERTAWFSWTIKRRPKQWYSMAYLYNIFRTANDKAAPYVVQVIVWGRDARAVEELKLAAQGFEFKGLTSGEHN